VRVVARDSSRDAADVVFPEIKDKYTRQLNAYKQLPDDELFTLERVKINVAVEDQPGRPISRVQCEECGEGVNDRREVVREGRTLCRPCADGGYYTKV